MHVQNLEMSALIDMLAQHTLAYTRILIEGGTEEEFNNNKQIIALLQAEIELRKKSTGQNTTMTDPDTFSESETA